MSRRGAVGAHAAQYRVKICEFSAALVCKKCQRSTLLETLSAHSATSNLVSAQRCTIQSACKALVRFLGSGKVCILGVCGLPDVLELVFCVLALIPKNYQ